MGLGRSVFVVGVASYSIQLEKLIGPEEGGAFESHDFVTGGWLVVLHGVRLRFLVFVYNKPMLRCDDLEPKSSFII